MVAEHSRSMDYTDLPFWLDAYQLGKELTELAECIRRQRPFLAHGCNVLRDAGEAIPVHIAASYREPEKVNLEELLPIMQIIVSLLIRLAVKGNADITDVKEAIKGICFLQCDILTYIEENKPCA
jgi:hypothetical protein